MCRKAALPPRSHNGHSLPFPLQRHRPTDREVLGARFIDRSIRPFFPKGYAHDTQLITSITSYSPAAPVEALAINAASAALLVSDIPFFGPVAAVRVGWVDGSMVLHPTAEELAASQLSLLYAGTHSRTAMIEMDAAEIPEDTLFEALAAAHRALEPLLALQLQLAAKVGKPVREGSPRILPAAAYAVVKEAVYEEACRIYNTHSLAKGERGAAVAQLTTVAAEALAEAGEVGEGHPAPLIAAAVNAVCREAFRDILLGQATPMGSDAPMLPSLPGQRGDTLQPLTLTKPVRVDGRDGNTVRPLHAAVDVFPRVHGSSVFSRGETQCVGTVTLGPPTIAQTLRPVAGGPDKKTFMLHYDFPPYSINEVGRVGGANRRMVGHGALAEKALAPLLPHGEDFPYVMRATSEVSGSDGSSSMATVCAVSLALRDAGVPMPSLVAGASVGLMTPPGLNLPDSPPAGAKAIPECWLPQGTLGSDMADPGYLLLSDIRGLEDHHGDMDFKIAGTEAGITAMQLDVKLPGVPLPVLLHGVKKARTAYGTVLRTMAAVQPQPRPGLKDTAPRMGLIPVPRDMRGRIIGPGGVILRGIQDATGAALRFLPDAEFLQIFAENEDGVELASEMVHAILDDEEAGGMRGRGGAPPAPRPSRLAVGECVTGTVTKVLDFGVVLGVGDSDDAGLLHISKMARAGPGGRRLPLPAVGTSMTVQVTDVDALGRAKFAQVASSAASEVSADAPPAGAALPTAAEVPVPQPRVERQPTRLEAQELREQAAHQVPDHHEESVHADEDQQVDEATPSFTFPSAPPASGNYEAQSPTLAACPELAGVSPTPGSFAYLSSTTLAAAPGPKSKRRSLPRQRGQKHGRNRR